MCHAASSTRSTELASGVGEFVYGEGVRAALKKRLAFKRKRLFSIDYSRIVGSNVHAGPE